MLLSTLYLASLLVCSYLCFRLRFNECASVYLNLASFCPGGWGFTTERICYHDGFSGTAITEVNA